MLDTFAGIGGFSYAAHKLVGGFETTQFVEIDPFCQKILKKHFPTVPCHDDIKTFSAIPGQYDVITGGFPCQDISVAGRREGITEQSRSGLFYSLMRVICMVRPRFVVMENVAAILNNGLDIVLGELSEAGYNAEWSIISASSLGASHRRSRWWCVATLADSNSKGLQREVFSKMESGIWSAKHTGRLDPDWRSYVSKPILPRGSYGLSYRVDRTRALGNSIVPSVAAIPLQRVHDLYYK